MCPCMPGLQDVVHRPHGYSNSTPAKGILRVHDLYHGGDFYLEAHDSAVSVVALNSDVSKIATASEKGLRQRSLLAQSAHLAFTAKRGACRQAHAPMHGQLCAQHTSANLYPRRRTQTSKQQYATYATDPNDTP